METADEDLPVPEVDWTGIFELPGREPRTTLEARIDAEEGFETESSTALDVEAAFCEFDLMSGCEGTRDTEIPEFVDLLDTLGALPLIEA